MITLTLTPRQTREVERALNLGAGPVVVLTEKQAKSIRGKLNVSQGGGRPPAKARCACGMFTEERAAKRGHRCES